MHWKMPQGRSLAGQEDKPVKSDAMVILMGSISDRVQQATDIYKKQAIDKVIIVKASMGIFKALEKRGIHLISNAKQVHDAIIALGILAVSIIIIYLEMLPTHSWKQ